MDDEDEHHRQAMLAEHDDDYTCGLFRWRPRWLQRFAHKDCFLVLFCLTSVLQGIYYTYFVSVLTTIEKLYQIPSRTTGLIMSATEIGQITGALALTYFGGLGHRPRWISAGMLVFAFAALLCSTPHYFFGSSTSGLFNQPQNEIEHGLTTTTTTTIPSHLCLPSTTISNLTLDVAACQQSEVIIRKSQQTSIVMVIFGASLLLIGIGTTAVNTLGIPYIDDNVAPKESPLYFGITIGVRVLGPVLGFLLGSICTSIPVDFPFKTSDLTPSDPNWIGAWWLGLFLVGLLLFLTSFPMVIFPRRLPNPDQSSYCHQQQQRSLLEHKRQLQSYTIKEGQTNIDNNDDNGIATNNGTKTMTLDLSQNLVLDTSKNVDSDKKNLKIEKKRIFGESASWIGFFRAVKRLLKNDIFLCRTASSVFHILPISGLYTFLPKYLESQFQLTAKDASLIAGLAGILVMGVGVFSSGTFMRKFKPSAQFVARWLAFAAISFVLGMVVLMFMGCPTNQFSGLKEYDDNGNQFISNEFGNRLECSQQCNCPNGKFEPVCMNNSLTYVSPCLAGCTTMYNSTTEKYYVDCSCSSSKTSSSSSSSRWSNSGPSSILNAKPGPCSLQCNTLTMYIIIFSITVLLHSTSEVGSMLLTLRCVEPQDKALALGFISFAIGLFGNVPCPIIYGAIVDSTCIFWEEDACGTKGACRLYDSTRFRRWFHGITAMIMLIGFIIDIVVCYKASAIIFNDEDAEKVENENEQQQQQQKQNDEDVTRTNAKQTDLTSPFLPIRTTFDDKESQC